MSNRLRLSITFNHAPYPDRYVDSYKEAINQAVESKLKWESKMIDDAKRLMQIISSDGNHKILGASDYYNFLLATKCALRGLELHAFHETFSRLILALDYPFAFFDDSNEDYDSFEYLPKFKGIYFCIRQIRGMPDEVWYVGKTNNFYARWKSHHKYEALKVLGDIFVYCVPMEECSDDEIAMFEKAYIEMLTPVFNNTSKPEKHLRTTL